MIYSHRKRNGSGDDHDLVDLPKIVTRACKEIREHIGTANFSSIVVQGVSGIVVGSPVALRLKKPLVVVRKPNDGSHHQEAQACSAYGDDAAALIIINEHRIGHSPLFLDDFSSSGETKRRVQAAIDPTFERPLVACYFYDNHAVEGRCRSW